MNRFAQSYQQQQAGAWTRIDMVLALYDGAITTLAQLVEAIKSEDDTDALKIRASKIVLGICHGLDLDYGELPLMIARLCQYVNEQIWNGDATGVEHAMKQLENVRESYLQIRDHAAELERNGATPPPRQDFTLPRFA